MSLMNILFGKKPAAPRPASGAATSFAPSSAFPRSVSPGNTPAMALRREILKLALHETLQRHGIPPHWISANTLTAASGDKVTGLHWRLSVHHWDPRLPVHMVALQNSLVVRVHRSDPLAQQWLLGVTWEFALEDDSECPGMPPAPSWTAPTRVAAVEAEQDLSVGHGDVIEGPAGLGARSWDARARLEVLLAPSDAAYANHASSATQPMFLATEPAGLDMPRGERPI